MPFLLNKGKLLQELFDAATTGDDDLVADATFRLDHCGVTMRAQNIILMAVNNHQSFPHAKIAHCIANKQFYRTAVHMTTENHKAVNHKILLDSSDQYAKINHQPFRNRSN